MRVCRLRVRGVTKKLDAGIKTLSKSKQSMSNARFHSRTHVGGTPEAGLGAERQTLVCVEYVRSFLCLVVFPTPTINAGHALTNMECITHYFSQYTSTGTLPRSYNPVTHEGESRRAPRGGKRSVNTPPTQRDCDRDAQEVRIGYETFVRARAPT